jgi:protein-S-isoprenylcysteine O-methyltransferase
MAMLWGVFTLAVAAGVMVARRGAWPLPLGPAGRDLLVIGAMGLGLAIRWAAILSLGRFFTVDVAIHKDQTVVRTGPYAWVRHPSYTGLLLLFLGLGLRFGSLSGLLAMMVPIFAALWMRILREERTLLAGLGEPYAAYCRATRRLIPGIL